MTRSYIALTEKSVIQRKILREKRRYDNKKYIGCINIGCRAYLEIRNMRVRDAKRADGSR